MDAARTAIVIGAGPAGLAAGACLKRAGLSVLLLEKGAGVAPAWRGHYDRLHLHTARGRSALPFRAMPRGGRYPSRDEVAAYLEGYARAEGLELRQGCAVHRVQPMAGRWLVEHAGGEAEADVVIFATGLNGAPRLPDWPGLAAFSGPVIHSSEYRNAEGMKGKRVLVAGIGNSGGDIALDLAEGGAEVTVSARGPVNILPKEIFGVPVTSMQLVQRTLGPRIADWVTGPVIRALIGRPSDYGFATPAQGPVAQVVKEGRIPLIDPGVLGAIRAGRVAVRGAVARVETAEVVFADGPPERVDAIVAATGYTQDLRPLLPGVEGVLDARGLPRHCGGPTAAPGLYFISYRASPNGQLRQIGIEARGIARAVTND